ncbi:MAG: leucine-rich repeat protein [Clostridia bacterium]|nr:leucine-rich repeat protein [Clostridia bacterium]
MTRENIMEAMNGIGEHLIVEAAETLGFVKGSAVVVKAERRKGPSAFSRFMNSGWGVAAVCALVAVSVMGGIIWAGQQPGVNPPVVTPEESETVTEAVGSEIESLEQTVEADTAAGTESEAETETKTDASEFSSLRLTDFSQVDPSVFTTFQCDVSITEDGSLLLSANWPYGSYASASFAVDPRDLIACVPGQDNAVYTPGAILFKFKRVNADNGTVDALFKGKDQPDAEGSRPPHLYQCDENTGYEYLILCTDHMETYMNGSQPAMTMIWIYLGTDQVYSDGRTMTVEEMIFYPTSSEALSAYSDYLKGEGIVAELLYNKGNSDTCYVVDNPNYKNVALQIPSTSPDGRKVKEVNDGAFRNNVFLRLLTVDEGVEYIGRDAFYNCTGMTVAYLPDSLIYLERSAFGQCNAMTEIYLGKGLRSIEQYALPISSEAFTDIYYNGTIADWYRIARRTTTANHPITVHCSDGAVDYSDPAPENLPDNEVYWDLSSLLAMAPAMESEAGETLVSCEAKVIRLKQGKYGAYMDVVLRWGLFVKQNISRYGFDILSIQDGRILAKPDIAPGMYRANGAGGMVYFEEAISGDYDAMIFMYDYGMDSGNVFRYRTLYYGIECDNGTVEIKNNYHMSPGLTEDGYIDRGYQRRELSDRINVFNVLKYDLDDYYFGSDGYYLMATAPDGNTTVFTPKNAPTFVRENVGIVGSMTLTDILNQGFPAFYEQYGPRKKD